MQVVQLLVSPVHRFSGRPAQGPSADPVGGLVQQIRVRRHLGIVGDRYFAQRAHRDAAVTIMAEENLPTSIDPAVDLQKTRRNILLRGIDIDAYVDWTVELDTGDGPILSPSWVPPASAGGETKLPRSGARGGDSPLGGPPLSVACTTLIT
ncbi:hypothetical protein ACFY2I_54465, partial [Streptomyces mirabilis]